MNPLGNGNSHGNGKHAPGDAAEQFIQLAKEKLREEMARAIPDELFQPSREAELKRRVETIVDAWLIRDKVPIGRQLRIKLLESILADIARGSRERWGD
jgi:Trp operon repressor